MGRIEGTNTVTTTWGKLKSPYYSKIEKYVYSPPGNKHPTAAGEDCILALVLGYK